MFSSFYGERNPTKETWQDAIVCFDANVLLDLYSYTPTTRDAFLHILEKLGTRCWLPYQAAVEYHKNLDARMSIQTAYYAQNSLVGILKEERAKLRTREHHPFLPIEKLEKLLGETIAEVDKIWQSCKGESKTYQEHCNALAERVAQVFENKVTSPLNPKTAHILMERLRARYELQLPPGYADQGKPENRFGDALIWEDMIVNFQGKKLFFVTNDKKEDWWVRRKDQRPNARPELVAEASQWDVEFYLLETKQFLKEAVKQLEVQIEAAELNSVVEEIERLEESPQQPVVPYENLLLPTILSDPSLENFYSPNFFSQQQCQAIHSAFIARLTKISKMKAIRMPDTIRDALEQIEFFWIKNYVTPPERHTLKLALQLLGLGADGSQKISKLHPTFFDADFILARLELYWGEWEKLI